MQVKSKCKNKNKKKKVLSLHSLHDLYGLHGLRSAVYSLHGLRFGVTAVSSGNMRSNSCAVHLLFCISKCILTVKCYTPNKNYILHCALPFYLQEEIDRNCLCIDDIHNKNVNLYSAWHCSQILFPQGSP